MVALAVAGPLRVWRFFVRRPNEFHQCFVVARNRQEAEQRAEVKAADGNGSVAGLYPVCRAEVELLQERFGVGDGAWDLSPAEWIEAIEAGKQELDTRRDTWQRVILARVQKQVLIAERMNLNDPRD